MSFWRLSTEKLSTVLLLLALLCVLPTNSRLLLVGPDEDLYDLGLAFDIAMNGDQIVLLDGLLTSSVR
jgi:hypothetical protein